MNRNSFAFLLVNEINLKRGHVSTYINLFTFYMAFYFPTTNMQLPSNVVVGWFRKYLGKFVQWWIIPSLKPRLVPIKTTVQRNLNLLLAVKPFTL